MNAKTILYTELKSRAIELRKQGKMYSEICSEIGHIPKGTLSHWLRGIELDDAQNDRIRKIMTENGSAGRYIGAQKSHQKRLVRLANISNIAKAEYPQFVNNEYFLAGLVLYLAEGSKKAEQFMFMNSDPKLIQFMIIWVTVIGKQDFKSLKFRLYIHELYAHENCENFWIKALNANPKQFLKTIYKPTGRVHKKNPSYKGCLRIEISGSELYWKTMVWKDIFYNTLK